MKSNKIDDFGDISPSYIPPSLTQKHVFHLLIKARRLRRKSNPVGGLKQPDCHIKATQLPCCGTLFSLKSCSIPHTLLSPFLHSPVCTTAVTHVYGGRHTRRTTTVAHACHGRRTLNSKGARAQQDVAKEAPDRSKGSTGSGRPL